MPELIKGIDLTPTTRTQVLEMFNYRWTVENAERALLLFEAHGGPPNCEMVTDEQWLSEHAFKVNQDGTLTKGAIARWIGTAQVGPRRKVQL